MALIRSTAVPLLLHAAAATADISCDPCIDRSQVNIGVVHHGVPSKDVFWVGVDQAIAQAADDLNVNLVYKPLTNTSTVYEDSYANIVSYCQGDSDVGQVDAILVSIHDDAILDALQVCHVFNISIAAFNAGYEQAKDKYLFFGQNETEAGREAGEALANNVSTTEKFCCINHAPGVDVTAHRCSGFQAGSSTKSTDYTEIEVDANNCTSFAASIIEGCSPDEGKDWINVGLYWAGQANHECGVAFLEDYPAYAAASDVSDVLYAGMKTNPFILFGIDQQSYLQGYLPLSFLTMAVTSSQVVRNDIIETGPTLHLQEPWLEELQCIESNFPVCQDELSGKITCDPCIDRSQVRIGVVHHGVPDANVFWADVDEAFSQGAKDMNIELVYYPLASENEVAKQMIDMIAGFCSGGQVDGLVVSVPYESLLAPLEECKTNSIPVVVVNDGYDFVKDEYVFFGQDEYQAGFTAGGYLTTKDVDNAVDRFCCLSQDPDLNVMVQRCQGFNDALDTDNKGD